VSRARRQAELDAARSPDLVWTHEAWQELGEKPLASKARWLQGRWRVEGLKKYELRAGRSVHGTKKLVVSMLPDEHLGQNFLTDAAREAAATWRAEGAGLVSVPRLERNLLSSQPLAFNLFGPYIDNAEALTAWVALIDGEVPDEVATVRLERALPKHQTFGGGSAFDAYVEYVVGGSRRFLGIECKYAEDLGKSGIKSIRHHKYPDGHQDPARRGQRPETYTRYERFTRHRTDLWKSTAADDLDVARLRQFWLNTLLAQKTLQVQRQTDPSWDRAISVVLTSAIDEDAEAATCAVRDQLQHDARRDVVWTSFDQVLARLPHQSWHDDFTIRYLDFQAVPDPAWPEPTGARS
jgi:hypothetical protein